MVALLKSDHGIELKSASSTIEEVVARQFVERIARARGLSIPSGPMFTGKPKAKGPKSARSSARTTETSKPASRPLPPPRLVKVKRTPPSDQTEETEPKNLETVEPTAPLTAPAIVEEPQPTAEAPVEPARPGRIVPPTLRLRVEDDSAPATPKAAAPTKRQIPTQPPRAVTRPVAAGGCPVWRYRRLTRRAVSRDRYRYNPYGHRYHRGQEVCRRAEDVDRRFGLAADPASEGIRAQPQRSRRLPCPLSRARLRSPRV